MPPAIILWALLAVAAALYPNQSRAQTTPGAHVPLSLLVGEDAAAIFNRAGSTVTASPFGPKVAASYDAVMRDTLNRVRDVPIRAGVTVPKARVAAQSAALCIAFPPRCVGQIAVGLGGALLFDAVSGAILASIFSDNYNWSLSLPAGQVMKQSPTPFRGANNIEVLEHCLSDWRANYATIRPLLTTLQPQFYPLSHEWEAPIAGLNPAVTSWSFLVRKADGGFQDRFFCNIAKISGTGQSTTSPATPSQIETAFTTNSANWQDGTFAAVFADAVTKGAKFPITIFDGAEMVAGPQPEVALATSTTTDANGVTQTQTQKSQAVVTTTGTTVGTAEATIVERVTTTATGPAGTTTTTTDTTPQIEDNNVTEQPPAEVTVNVEFPEPVFSDTALPEVPDLYEQKYPNGLAGVWADKGPQLMASTFVASVQGMFPTLSGSGSCPVWAMDLNYGPMGNFGVADLSPPCWIWGAVALILLTTACFTAWRIIFGG